MDVFDSSVWLFGLVGDCGPAEELIDSVVDGTREVVVSPYIFEEVFQGVRQAGSGDATPEQIQTGFASMIHGNQRIVEPDQRDVENMNLQAVRTSPEITLMADTYGLQSKDVPVLVTAHQADGMTDLFTSDRSFSEFNPTDYGISNVRMHYVDCSD